MAHPAAANAIPTCETPWRTSRKVKSAAPARPSNHTVIWIFPGAFIVFETNSGAREKMRLRHDEKPTLGQICAERRLINPGDFARFVVSLRPAPRQVRLQEARQGSEPRCVAAAYRQSNKTPTKERRTRLPPKRRSKNAHPGRYD